jgi:ribulose-5-phosphate 4-epimerase/fuculose-1-phosphate aldolase
MKKIAEQQLVEFIGACHRAAKDYALMQCSSGNMSWRVDGERMLVSGTRTWLADIRSDQVAVVRIADGEALNKVKASVEAGFHAGVLRRRTDMNVVLHFQTPFATTLACREDLEKINFFVTPEIPYYIGQVAVLPYIQPGSAALAKAVVSTMATHDMAVLRNHGMVTVGTTFDDAIQKAVFFEMACGIIVRLGRDVRPLSGEAIRDLEHA